MSEIALEFDGVWKKFRKGEIHDSLRDLIPALPVATGAARDTMAIINGAPTPPTGWKVVHVPTITVGLDIVLEKRRGRRY